LVKAAQGSKASQTVLLMQNQVLAGRGFSTRSTSIATRKKMGDISPKGMLNYKRAEPTQLTDHMENSKVPIEIPCLVVVPEGWLVPNKPTAPPPD
jgi:hypothetical protein